MHKVDTSKNNYFIKHANLWNACIKHLLDFSELSYIALGVAQREFFKF